MRLHMRNMKDRLDSSSASYAGQKVYTPAVLKIYDFWVLGISNSLIWKCPTQKMLAFYNQNISGNHLDVGVGTGYYLDRCRFPKGQPQIVLADLNPHSLELTAKRIQRYNPLTLNLDILNPFSISQPPFDSIGIQFLLHCLPGKMTEKEKVFLNLKPYLNKNGVIFGSTILGQGVKKSKIAKKLMSFYNSKRIFSNEEDSLESLQYILNKNFKDVSIQTEGCVALFKARA